MALGASSSPPAFPAAVADVLVIALIAISREMTFIIHTLKHARTHKHVPSEVMCVWPEWKLITSQSEEKNTVFYVMKSDNYCIR